MDHLDVVVPSGLAPKTAAAILHRAGIDARALLVSAQPAGSQEAFAACPTHVASASGRLVHGHGFRVLGRSGLDLGLRLDKLLLDLERPRGRLGLRLDHGLDARFVPVHLRIDLVLDLDGDLPDGLQGGLFHPEVPGEVEHLHPPLLVPGAVPGDLSGVEELEEVADGLDADVEVVDADVGPLELLLGEVGHEVLQEELVDGHDLVLGEDDPVLGGVVVVEHGEAVGEVGEVAGPRAHGRRRRRRGVSGERGGGRRGRGDRHRGGQNTRCP